MFFSKLFKKNDVLDKNMERHLLFAPNYLITTQELNHGKRYIYGGHSILIIEETPQGPGLYFERSRTARSNKIIVDTNSQIHIGFQSIQNDHYLILGLRQELTQLKAGDFMDLEFNSNQNLRLQLESPAENFGNSKHYACNLRAQLDPDMINSLKTKTLVRYSFENAKGKKIAEAEFDNDFGRKLRELAQTFSFTLMHYYKKQ